MRKIKFRGKVRFSGEWAYGQWLPISKTICTETCIEGTAQYRDLFVEESTVGQFTGLPSQDKEDIYEGDRLFDYDDDYYVVEFSEGRFVAVGDGFEVDLFEIADRCSIIGNIHDNKEIK